MPDTSYTGIQVPDGGDGYSFEQALGDLADSARVVIPAASPTGMAQVATAATTAGFPASATAPLFCYRTDQAALYVNAGNGWRRLSPKSAAGPYAMSAGRVDYDMAGTSSKSYVVTFPTGRFGFTPVITFGLSPSADLRFYLTAASPSGFTVNVETISGGTSTSSSFVRWTAVQMNPDSTEG